MPKFATRMSCAVVAVTAATGLGAPPAHAAGWNVTGGGTITAAGSVTVTIGGVSTSCDVQGTGSIPNGTGRPNPVGGIGGIGFDCDPIAGLIAITVDPSQSLPWSINADSQAGDVVAGRVTGINLQVSGTACSLVVDGTGASAHNGSMNASYDNSATQLAFPGSGNLRAYNVSGCLGLVSSGDPVSVQGALSISPAVQINANP